MHTVEHTAGYDVSSTDDVIPGSTVISKGDKMEVITRLTLCDDPYRLTPRTDQNRELIEYCSKSFGHLCSALRNLLAALLT